MIEFSLPDSHPLVNSLDKMLSWVRTSRIPERAVGQPLSDDLSEEHLQKRMAVEVPNRTLTARFDHHPGYNFSEIQRLTVESYEEKTGRKGYNVTPVAKTWYPAGGGFLGWHLDQDGERFYSAYAEGKSFFRYRDPQTKEIVTSWDAPGEWSFRIFSFHRENPMWHCIGAEDVRVSVGYRFNPTQ